MMHNLLQPTEIALYRSSTASHISSRTWIAAQKPGSQSRSPSVGPLLHFSYQVSSVNFSRRKLGHAHDTPLTLKKVQVGAKRVCTRTSLFVSKTVTEIRAYFLPMTKIQLKRVNHKLSRQTVDAPSTGRFHEASSGPEKLKFGSARLSRKKRRTSWTEESFF